jgi:5-methylcytosine-specific restriction endonuclease McrA
MSKPKNLGSQIKQLRKEGKTYREIQQIINCSSNTVYYHLSSKPRKKRKKYKYKKHPYLDKLMTYIRGQKINRIYYKKLKEFLRSYKIIMKDSIISVQDVIAKFGSEPTCYLTGDKIDISQTNTYNFDHIIPRSRGGQSTLDNLGICTKEANMAKSDKTPEEFFELCKKVLKHNNQL